MEDEREIIYIALCNSVDDYMQLLEVAEKSEIDMLKYIISRHWELIDKYAAELGKETTIKRPTW